MKSASNLLIALGIMLTSCSQAQNTTNTETNHVNTMSTDSSNWKKLTPEEERVIINKGTEALSKESIPTIMLKVITTAVVATQNYLNQMQNLILAAAGRLLMTRFPALFVKFRIKMVTALKLFVQPAVDISVTFLKGNVSLLKTQDIASIQFHLPLFPKNN
jgi:hypothetical protein